MKHKDSNQFQLIIVSCFFDLQSMEFFDGFGLNSLEINLIIIFHAPSNFKPHLVIKKYPIIVECRHRGELTLIRKWNNSASIWLHYCRPAIIPSMLQSSNNNHLLFTRLLIVPLDLSFFSRHFHRSFRREWPGTLPDCCHTARLSLPPGGGHLPRQEPVTEINGGPDLFINKGSTINLTCTVKYAPEPPPAVVWKHNRDVSKTCNTLTVRGHPGATQKTLSSWRYGVASGWSPSQHCATGCARDTTCTSNSNSHLSISFLAGHKLWFAPGRHLAGDGKGRTDLEPAAGPEGDSQRLGAVHVRALEREPGLGAGAHTEW